MLQRLLALSGLLLHRRQIAIQEGRIRRCGNGLLIRGFRLVPPPGVRRRLRACEHILHGADAQHLHAGTQFGPRRIFRERRLETGERVAGTVHLEQRLAAAHQRRDVAGFGFERATHRYRLSLGTGMTVLVAVGLAVEAVSGLPALAWLSLATAVAFPLGRLYDYAVTIRSGRPARELRRILEGS